MLFRILCVISTPENEKTLKTENQRKTTRTKANTKLQSV